MCLMQPESGAALALLFASIKKGMSEGSLVLVGRNGMC